MRGTGPLCQGVQLGITCRQIAIERCIAAIEEHQRIVDAMERLDVAIILHAQEQLSGKSVTADPGQCRESARGANTSRSASAQTTRSQPASRHLSGPYQSGDVSHGIEIPLAELSGPVGCQ